MSYSLNNKLGERRVFSDDFLMLDTARRWEVIVKGSEVRALTATQWRILFVLCQSANYPVSNKALAYEIYWDMSKEAKQMIKWHLSHLRKELTYRGDPPPIETVRGFGYKYNPYFERS